MYIITTGIGEHRGIGTLKKCKTKMYIITTGSLRPPFFDASGNKNIGATIRIGREIRCLPYAGFFWKISPICWVLIFLVKGSVLGISLLCIKFVPIN